MNKDLVNISASPHIRDKSSTTAIMGDVIIALIPAAIMGIINFGFDAYLLIMVCMVSCVAFEALSEYWFKKKLTVKDLSAAVTGLLLALNLPPTLPIWMAILILSNLLRHMALGALELLIMTSLSQLSEMFSWQRMNSYWLISLQIPTLR